MTSKPLWQIAVRSSPEYEPAIAAALSAQFQLPASSYVTVTPPLATVSLYSPNHPGPQTTVAARIHAALARAHPLRQNPIPCQVSVRRLPACDWTLFWKRHFSPISVGRSLLVKPSWSRRRAAPGQKTVILNPGLSFGTGHHPTTAFCLRQLARLRPQEQPRSFLDLGCGSGILAIAAAKLAYRPVEAIDIDPVAVRIALENTRRNRVHAKVRVRHRDIRELPTRSKTRFDVVCANLATDLLLEHAQRIIQQLAPAGHLVLAGILTSEFSSVQRLLLRLGLRLTAYHAGPEWHSGRFQPATGPAQSRAQHRD